MANQELLQALDSQYDYKSRKIRLEWIVAKALIETKTKTVIQSPPFKVNIDGSTYDWNVDLYRVIIGTGGVAKVPATINQYPLNFNIILDIGEVRDWIQAEKIAYDVSLKSKDGTMILIHSLTDLLTSDWDEYCWTDDLEILQESYVNEKLILVLDVTLPPKRQFYVENDNQRKCKNPESKAKLFENLIGMHKLSAFADLVVFCGDQKFLCHKLLLASRSSVFREMLENEKDGKIEGELEITDTSPDVFKIILDFINTGEIDEDVELGTEVFKQAVKYNLTDLVEICEVVLLKNLSEENCLSTLVVINDHKRDSDILQDIIKFISMNALNLMTTENWRSFSRDYPHLMTDIIRFLANKCKQDESLLPTLRCEGEEPTS